MIKHWIYKKTDVLSASEIGQYKYCSYAWFLQRCGYKAESVFLESGKQVHSVLGYKIDDFEKRILHVRWYTLLGIISFFLGIFLILEEVAL